MKAALQELRVESRSNIFVMATIYAPGGSTPVRVRNMSRTGALVEAPVLPAAGSRVRLSRGSLTVVGDIRMPLATFPRRMTVIALDRSRTLLYSPVPLGEHEMVRIERLGEPAYLVVPNPAHRLDIRPFRRRYPRAKVITAPGAKAAVEKAVTPVRTQARLGQCASLVTAAGTKERELALVVRGDGISIVTNDIIGNVRSPKGAGAWLLTRLLRFGPRPHVPRDVRGLLIANKAALAAQFREWAGIDGLRRLIPSHGQIIDDPAPVLRRLADELD